LGTIGNIELIAFKNSVLFTVKLAMLIPTWVCANGEALY